MLCSYWQQNLELERHQWPPCLELTLQAPAVLGQHTDTAPPVSHLPQQGAQVLQENSDCAQLSRRDRLFACSYHIAFSHKFPRLPVLSLVHNSGVEVGRANIASHESSCRIPHAALHYDPSQEQIPGRTQRLYQLGACRGSETARNRWWSSVRICTFQCTPRIWTLVHQNKKLGFLYEDHTQTIHHAHCT